MAGSSKGSAKRVIILFMLAMIVVGGFAMLVNRNKSTDVTPTQITEVEDALARNLNTNYPETPKELLKYYSQITKCFYSMDYTEEQLDELAVKSRELLDEDLKAQQTDEEYLRDLKTSIDIFKSLDRTISSYSVSSAADIEYNKYEGADWAKAYCVFTVRDGKKMVATQEEFLLRKSTDGHWKIFGWRIVEDNEETDNG